MNVLDLFSGIGGFSLGLERVGMKTIAFCEKDKFCQKVLKKHWPDVPIFDDITRLKGDMINETIDLVCGGFPCQPFSVAGKRKGKEDNRHLWPEMLRIIQETKPSWVIGENVAGIINLELEQVCIDLEAQGYEVQPIIIPACAVNAPHRRDRVWIIAYSGCEHGEGITPNTESHRRNSQAQPEMGREEMERGRGRGFDDSDKNAPDTTSKGLEGANRHQSQHTECTRYNRNAEWDKNWIEVAAEFCGISYGVSNRVDRLKSLGNSVVPQIVEILGNYIMDI